MRKFLFGSLIACATAAAFADVPADTSVHYATEFETITATAVYDGAGNPIPQDGGSLRVQVTGYQNMPGTGETVFSPGPVPRRAMDDLAMVCGPAEIQTGTFSVNSLQFSVATNSALTAPVDFDAVLIFFNDLNTSSAAPSPINTNEIGRVRVAFTQVPPPVAPAATRIFIVNPVTLTTPIVFTDNDIAIDIQLVNPGGVVPPGGVGTVVTSSAVTVGLFGLRSPTAGDSTDTYWRDVNGDGDYDANEARTFTGPNNLANFILKLDGDFVGTNPPTPVEPALTCLGAAIDDDDATPTGPIVISSAIAANEVKWFSIVLTQDVLASVNGVPSTDTFDIHTDGSALSGSLPTDTVLSLYRADGSLLAANDDGPNVGTGQNQSVLSFGDNLSRATLPSFIAMAGEDGALPRGRYLLGVSAFPAATIRCGWRHTSTSPETGTVVLNIVANLSNGCPGDLDGNRSVNESDLGILLGSWLSGACGDTNRDGQTNEADLGTLLANWQVTCP